MPVYEFRCEDCGKKFDVVATITEKEAGIAPACPRCGGARARQVFGRFTILAGSKTESDDFEAGDSDTESLDAMGDDESAMDDFDEGLGSEDDDLG
jgi:putative FmdB family regulatory protein